MRTGRTHLLLDVAGGATADGQQRCIAERLARCEVAEQSVALREREASASPQTPAVEAGAGDVPTCWT